MRFLVLISALAAGIVLSASSGEAGLAAPLPTCAENVDLRAIWPGLRFGAAECVVRIRSPDGRWATAVSDGGSIAVVSRDGRRLNARVRTPYQFPGSFAWSPASDGFAINDGEGGGVGWSRLRYFRIAGGRLVEDGGPQRRAVRAFRRTAGCLATSPDPSVWVIGWSRDGTRMYGFAQDELHHPCRYQTFYVGLVFRSSDGALLEILSERQATHRFGNLLAANMRMP